MSRVAYVNGLYVPHADAAVHVEDRGYQFADGVYEVCEVRGGRMVDERRHMERLQRSLRELRIAMPMPPAALGVVLRETIRRNRVREGIVYLQVTRGVARRDHYFPSPDTLPSIVVTARATDQAKAAASVASGAAIITVPDNRWDRVDIKTVGLLPNVLAKQAAKEAGAREAWFVRDGVVTEGGSTNAWIVTQAGAIVTRPAESGILRGITRTVLFEVANRLGLTVEERGFTLDEALAAREAFISSASNVVVPIVSIDGKTIGDGKPGPVARSLRDSFYDVAEFARK
ncbi:D-amino-acid transaminase [Ancylobacter sp. Lp-2]|uniref:D-amino-acid transaminase n=1 Tax=Ancylobacter sp. Lp-2 TaxID=2881339 RepID=UPI001E29D155|nr:D-amino-acid transaminase [Ancylobacter sp. Lp-2]MCB4768287.1 D-amino-acid transaminase [Ancylobacter sp. Lp-2]